MEEEYRIERLNDENIHDLIPLYKDAFNEDRTVSLIKAKFNTKSIGGEYYSFIAYSKDNIAAAFYALFPVEITSNKAKYLCAQVGDLMTHSSHRRKGLFYKLAIHTHEFAKKNGVSFIFTFPYDDATSYKGFINKLNFIHSQNLNGFYIKTNTLPLFRWSGKFKFSKYLYSKYVKFIQKIALPKTNLFNYLRSPETAEIIRNEAFLDYKSGYSSIRISKLNDIGIIYKIKPDGTFAIGDIEKKGEKEVVKLIKKLKTINFFLGIRIIQIEVSSNHYLDQILSKRYVKENHFRLCFLLLDEAFPFDNVQFTYLDIDSF